MGKIDITNWAEFKIKDLGFENYHGSRLKKADRIEGNIPLITAGKENQGVVCTIGNNRQTYENPITVDMFGNVFYHEGIFDGDDNIYFFINHSLNKQIKLFIVTSLQKSIQFAYVDQFRQQQADNLTVFLPCTKKGTPDWEFMEKYIRNIEAKIKNNLQCLQQLFAKR